MTKKNFTALDIAVLNALDTNKWIDRKELSSRLGRPKYVSSHDITVLKRLTKRGLINSRKSLIGTVAFTWEYRLTEAGETAKAEYTGEAEE